MTAAVMAIISSGVSIGGSENGVHASSNNLHGSGSCNGNGHCCSHFGIVTDMTMKAITKLLTQVLVAASVVLMVFVIYSCEW